VLRRLVDTFGLALTPAAAAEAGVLRFPIECCVVTRRGQVPTYLPTYLPIHSLYLLQLILYF
jgi:hypothetical protein